jgi:hypothetical protein
MKSRRVSILSALVLMFVGAFATNPLLAAGLGGTGRPADDARVVERPARGTIILDGVPFAPGELKRSGKSLTFVHTREGEEKGIVYAFTAPEVADEFMRREFRKEFGVEPGVEASHVLCQPNQWQQHYSLFNKDVGCGGSANLTMYEGQQYANLDFDGWNNRISCVKAACVGAWTTLYSCRFFEMDWQPDCGDPDRELISPGVIVTDLNTKGFNNRTSSIRFCYTFGCGDI